MKPFLALTFLFTTCLAAQAQKPSIIAHRGSSFEAPENTVASAKLAWEQNADAVELDIFLSADDRIMVIHDSNTLRTTEKQYKIDQTNSDILRGLDAGAWKNEKYTGEKIPFLEEMIATVPDGKKMVIEIKCKEEVLPALSKVVENSGKKNQLIFIAFDWNTIVATKKMFASNKCYWLSSSADEVQTRFDDVARNGLDGINLHYKIIDRKLVEKAKSLKLETLSWTVDDPAEAKRLLDAGVVGITTNRPDLIRQSIENK